MHVHNCNSNGVIAVESLSSGEHFVHHSAYGVDIALCVSNVSACLFRADIVNASDSLIGSCLSFFTGELCNAEVHDLDSTVSEHHDVLRLDITVNYTLVVSMLQSSEDLYHEVNSILPCEDFFLLDVFLESNTVDVFHDDILNFLRKSDIIYLYDVRV